MRQSPFARSALSWKNLREAKPRVSEGRKVGPWWTLKTAELPRWQRESHWS